PRAFDLIRSSRRAPEEALGKFAVGIFAGTGIIFWRSAGRLGLLGGAACAGAQRQRARGERQSRLQEVTTAHTKAPLSMNVGSAPVIPRSRRRCDRSCSRGRALR